MESLRAYLEEALTLGREAFAKAHPHTWLVVQVEALGDAAKLNIFATVAFDRGASVAQLAAPENDDGLGYLTLPVRKSDASPFQNAISVGRARNNDLAVRGSSVSKLHARVRIEADGTHTVTDAGSTNGTLINGTRLQAGTPSPIKSGDRLQLGAVLTIFLDSEALFDFMRELKAEELRRRASEDAKEP